MTLPYWAGRLDSAGGSFAEIIEAYANSAESQALYGTINSGNISNVVNDIYNALFGRDAEPEGLNYYVNGFNLGQFTPATIMLNVLYGAQNEDLQCINNKLAAANLFTRTIDPELDGMNFQVTYAGNPDAIAGRNFLALFACKVVTQAETTAYIKGYIADIGDPILSVAPAVGPAYELVPSVISLGSGLPLQVIFDASPDTTAVQLNRDELFGGSIIPLVNVTGTNRWVATLSEAEALQGYQSLYPIPVSYLGTLSTDDSIRPFSVPLQIPVFNSNIPSVNVIKRGENIQESQHIVNIQYDSLYASQNSIAEINEIFFQYYNDDYDFLIENWLARDDSYWHYIGIRNSVLGTGMQTFDNGAAFGAAGTQKLKGHIYLTSCDLTDQGIPHEMGHAYMNFLKNTPLSFNIPHFPVSTTAFGIMGRGGPLTSYKLTKLANGNYIVEQRETLGDFNEFELYMLGLLPRAEVPDQIVFQDQSVILTPGTILVGPGTTVTIDQIISSNGPRVPAYPTAQNAFRVATIVVSRGRLLSPQEMAYFDFVAARGEARVPLGNYFYGYNHPFYVSTGGRATLSTTIH